MQTVTNDFSEVPWADFFNSYRFFTFNHGDRKAFFLRLLKEENGEALCTAHFTEKEPGTFVSSYRGSYGGIDAVTNDPALFEKFLQESEAILHSEDAKRLEITLSPTIYHPERIPVLTKVLLKKGFTTLQSEINQFVGVDDMPLVKKMEAGKAKRVRKCEREGCTLERLQSEAEFTETFEMIRT